MMANDKTALLPVRRADSTMVGEKNHLGLLNGVVVPCCLNILGVILFLRLSWAVGQAGWVGVLGMFALGESLAVLTILSLAAITSNGEMKGGGSYFMISRCLGPEFGGSIGLLFYLAYCLGTCFYVIGFAEEVSETWFKDSDTAAKRWLITGVSSAALACVTIISLIGAGAFTKVNVPLFVLQFSIIIIGIGCMLFADPKVVETIGDGNETIDLLFVGPDLQTFKDNALPEYTDHPYCPGDSCNFASVFAIIFPAMTGIMEGANLSGDLADPAATIGPGTLIAVSISIVTYLLLIGTFAAVFPRDTLVESSVPMQDVTVSQYIIVAGVFISAFSSALGSMFGGARVLQALARDKLPFKATRPFGKGSLKGDEPQRAVMMTWFIAQICCLMGDLDVVAPIISSFFCLSYAAVNFACFILSVAGTPNWRPRFKWYSKWSALIGVLLNLGVLFYIDPLYAGIALACLILLFVFIVYNGPVTEWGDVSQAILFHQVRKYLLRLDPGKSHVKFWRPSVLLLVDDLDGPLISFCNNLKKGGLYVIGSALVGDVTALSAEGLNIRSSWEAFILKTGIKAFPQVAVAPTARIAYSNLMLCSGLGGMRPNTVVLPLFTGSTDLVDRKAQPTQYYDDVAKRMRGWPWNAGSNSTSPVAVENTQEYVMVLRDVLYLHMNLLIACNFDKLDAEFLLQSNTGGSPIRSRRRSSDAGPSYPSLSTSATLSGPTDFAQGTLSLQLQLAHIIHLNPAWETYTTIRVLNVLGAEASKYAEDDAEGAIGDAEAKNRLLELCRETRIEAEVCVIRVASVTNPMLGFRCSSHASIQGSTSPLASVYARKGADDLRSPDSPLASSQKQPPAPERSQPSSLLMRSFSALEVTRQRTDEAAATEMASSTDSATGPIEDLIVGTDEMSELGTLMAKHSGRGSTKLLFALLPPPPPTDGPRGQARVEAYMNGLRAMVHDLPPTILVAGGAHENVIPSEQVKALNAVITWSTDEADRCDLRPATTVTPFAQA